MSVSIRLLLAGSCLLFSQIVASAAVTLPKVFADHMVLQREQPVSVWGWADPGEKVTVEFAGQSKSATADATGKWTVTLDAMPASAEPRSLVVKSAAITHHPLTISDVLVGEVWLCSGQSNMEWTMNATHEAKTDIPAANFPLIRHFGVPKTTAATTQKDVNGSWKVCSPATVPGFTGVGYFFALELHRTLNVPVGLLHSSWGGTRIEPWTTPDGFALVPSLAGIRKQVEAADPKSEANRAKLKNYLTANEAWLAKARASLDAGGSIEAPPAFPAEASLTRGSGDPCALYNAMIAPLVPYGIKGAIWYQGESNHGEGKLYTDKTVALVEGWRKIWNQGSFPYYFVQIAPFQYGEESPEVLATFWEAQAAIETALPNSGMAVIHDVGDIKDIHPRNKKDVGRRLALQALAKTYSKTDVVFSGPVFKALKQEGDKLRVTFDHAHGGLKTRDGKAPSHFEIIGPDTDYVPADAVMDGDSILLSATNCPAPAAVRFGWHKTAEPNLQNGVGLPARQFRAGSVPRVDSLSKIPEANAYKLIYDLDLAKLGATINYDVDHTATAPKFDRVAYFIELKKGSEPARHLWVSMDAFTADAKKLGVPTFASGIKWQQPVANLTVVSDAPGITTGEKIGAGNLEFWPNNYAVQNTAAVPGADNGLYDTGDMIAEPADGYGSMQVHNTAAKQTLFALNQWSAGGGANLGIGNSTGETRDWTFVSNAGSYTSKRLRILVRHAN